LVFKLKWYFRRCCSKKENKWGGVESPKQKNKLSSIELFNNKNKNSRYLRSIATNDENEIGNSRAIYIGPYYTSAIGLLDFNSGGWQQVLNSSCPTFDNPTVIADSSVSLDTFKNLSSYGTILIATHGDSWYNGIFSIWNDEFGDKPGLIGWTKTLLAKSVISSGISLPTDSGGNYLFGDYESDLKAGRLAISEGGTLYMTPAFFNFYNSSFPNSIISMTSCRGFYNSELADEFIAKGAGVFFGYSNYVSGTYAANISNTIFNQMLIHGKTFKEAYDEAIATYGNNDGGIDPAYLRIKGNDKLIYTSNFKNNSFETGNLNNWEKIGDGRVISKLGNELPTDGSYMAIISTGLGFTTEHGEIVQDFCIKDNAKSITFDWNFFSEEFVEFCGDKYQDWFVVSITDIDSNTTETIMERKIDDLCSSVYQVNNSFDQGDAYATGWQKSEPYDLTLYRGKAVKLNFSCNDVSDSIYDSAILVDNIQILFE